MAWGEVILNDGRRLPEIGFGSWTAGSGQTVIDQVEQAIETGFDHIDTAQSYANETEVGKGIRESGLDRKQIWITTKWSGKDGKGIKQSLHESLSNLGVQSVDLYLIHSPRLTNGDPASSWKEFQSLQSEGLIKSIGVSNFKVADLEVLRQAHLKTPVVNQILLHPYVYNKTKDLLAYHLKHNIVTEAYSTLYPLTHPEPNSTLLPLLDSLARKYKATPAMILFSWARNKGAVVVTATRQKERLVQYLKAGDITLDQEEVDLIDEEGAKFSDQTSSKYKLNNLLSFSNEKGKEEKELDLLQFTAAVVDQPQKKTNLFYAGKILLFCTISAFSGYTTHYIIQAVVECFNAHW